MHLVYYLHVSQVDIISNDSFFVWVITKIWMINVGALCNLTAVGINFIRNDLLLCLLVRPLPTNSDLKRFIVLSNVCWIECFLDMFTYRKIEEKNTLIKSKWLTGVFAKLWQKGNVLGKGWKCFIWVYVQSTPVIIDNLKARCVITKVQLINVGDC